MRYFIAIALAALMTSGAFFMTPASASEDEQSQEEQVQVIEEEGQQEDVQIIEEGEQMQGEEAEQMQSQER